MQEIEHKLTSNAPSPLAGAHAEGGGSTGSERELYEALDDLMSVVEALCPEWPPRGIFQGSGRFLL
jgi:hypothetical protein